MKWRFEVFLLTENVGIGYGIEERIIYKIIELFLVVQLCIFGHREGRFPVRDLPECLSAVVPDATVVNKEFSCNSFAFVWK